MTKSSVTQGGGWFFYSNSPEVIDGSGIADNGYYLNHVTNLVGTGQLYVWHQNAPVNADLKHEILIYNPNAKSITVTPTNVGLTNGSWDDVNAWTSFWNSTTVPAVTVPAKGYAALFKRTIPSGNPFGVLARMNVKYTDGTGDAAIDLYDLMWYNDSLSGNAHAFAAADPVSSMRARGYATTGYFNYVNLNQVNISSTNPMPAFKIGASGDTFAGADLPFIHDPSGVTTGVLEGAYGCQQYLSIPVKNTDTVSRTIRIFAVNDNNSDIYINAYGYGGNTAPSGTNGKLNPGQYFDMFEDTLAAGASATYTFQFVTPAGSSGGTTVGVRVVGLT
ncbi:MAG: hypothetical protein WCC10_09970 [Tumebacillaceae bacterium]